MSAHQTLETTYPNSMTEADFVTRATTALKAVGIEPKHAIACTSVCRDEMCRSLPKEIQSVWGDGFKLSSLAGLITAGRTGFGAAHHHAPNDDGRERYVYVAMPHIGIGEGGTPGEVVRFGRAGSSSACGALVGFQSQLLQAAKQPGVLDFDLDEGDLEQSHLRVRLMKKLAWGELPDIVRLTQLCEEVILEDLEARIAETVDTDHADYAVFVGTQIHLPHEDNRVRLSTSYAVLHGERTELSL